MGKVLAERVRAETGVKLEWRNIEIHPETPPEGRKITQLFPEYAISQMYMNLNRMGKAYGLEFALHDQLSNSRKAILLGEYIQLFHPEQEDSFHEEVFESYFTKGRDIGDTEVLKDIIENCGLDPQIVEEAQGHAECLKRMDKNARSSQEDMITGTPTFIIGQEKVVGAQPYPILLAAVRSVMES